MELVTRMVQAAADSAPAAPRPCLVALAIPTLNEEASIGDVLRAVHRGVVSRIIVADGGSTDATVARARDEGAEVIDSGRGYGRACLAAAMAAADAGVVVFMDGDGADDPAFVAALIAPIQAGAVGFVIGSRPLGVREPGRMSGHQLAAGC